MKPDRYLGLFLLLLAVGYGLGALGLEAEYLADPLGPRAFPLLLAGVLGVLGLWLLLFPGSDPAPRFPAWRPQALAVGSFVLYAYALVPLGFVLATTLEVGFLARLLGAGWSRGLFAGFAFAASLYLIFVFGLGIPLPLGQWWPG